MEPLGIWVNNGVRKENLEFTKAITPLLERVYGERGVKVIRVPDMSREERKNFILDHAGRILGRKLPKRG